MITRIRSTIIHFYQGIGKTVYNWRIRNWAYSRIKSYKPTNIVLSKEQIKEIKNHYGRYFRPKIKFYQFYIDAFGKFDINFLPDDVYYTIIDRYYNDWDKALMMDDKCYYDRLFKFMPFKMPESICYLINGFWLSSDYKPITKQEAVEIICANTPVFLKQSIDSEGGHGVKYIDKGIEKKIIDKTISELGDNIIVQNAIEQSPQLAQLNGSSVNTLRILSFLKADGSVKIYSSILRMGIKGSRVDNASSGGITCGIQPNGQLKNRAFSALGEVYDCHPNSRIKFETITIPGFKSICDKIRDAHPQIPNFRLLSWDIALDKNNEPILLEINMKFGELDFHQLNNGPIFGDDTLTILKEVYNK